MPSTSRESNRRPHIRPYRPRDRAAVADVCVRTAHLGGDARHLYPDQELMAHLFAAPYATLEPDLAFVLDDGSGTAVGYVLGTRDTHRFVREFRARWLPRVAARHPLPAGEPTTPSEEMALLLHHPERMIVPALRDYPAHLHIDLLPAWQRRGFGRTLMHTFLRALHDGGTRAVHLAMVTANTPARAFYDRLGFHEIPVPDPGPLTFLGRTTGQEESDFRPGPVHHSTVGQDRSVSAET